MLYARDKIQATLAELTKTVEGYREMVNLSNLRYNSGLASYFEVLYAMQLLFPAEVARVGSQVNLLIDYVNIYKALGGGWNIQPDDANPTWFSPAHPATPVATGP